MSTENDHPFGWRPDRFAEILTPELADRLSSAVAKPVEELRASADESPQFYVVINAARLADVDPNWLAGFSDARGSFPSSPAA